MLALLIYTAFGLELSWRLLPEQKAVVKWWLGLVFGQIALMWLPCLFAFFVGFTKPAQYAALILCLAVIAALEIRAAVRRPGLLPSLRKPSIGRTDAMGLIMSGIGALFCGYLLYTHVLMPKADGSLWVGQSTYGDLAMHLGFIEGLYRQGTFPPEYTIYPGQTLNYPFLVDAAGASLRFFGLSLRMSVIVPGILMTFCVFWGFWLLADRLTGRLAPTLMSWLLFAANGGFGFVLFFGKYRFSDIFTGFYTTPTNLTSEDIRWSNVICDMMIPQRTTMAGWCVILPAIFLLILLLDRSLAPAGETETGAPKKGILRGGRKVAVILAVVAGSMPMIHTHSFLALGLLSAAWFFCVLPKAVRRGRAKELIVNYVIYGAVCMALAAPQLLKWTMDSVATGNLLKLNLGWVAGANGAIGNVLLFYIVNIGVVFVAMWFMIPSLRDEALTLFIGASAIFVLSNLVAFQPNLYDNNKLLYIWYMLIDILVCDWLWCIIEEARPRVLRSAIAGVIVFLGTFSGFLTMFREAVSEYQLFSYSQVEAADYILENTEPDSLFLTAANHANPVPVLTGRNIVCGSSLYLFFHGVEYQQREAALPDMFAGGDAFVRYADSLGIDYVYLSPYEYGNYTVNYDWFAENYPLVYEQDGISIFRITD